MLSSVRNRKDSFHCDDVAMHSARDSRTSIDDREPLNLGIDLPSEYDWDTASQTAQNTVSNGDLNQALLPKFSGTAADNKTQLRNSVAFWLLGFLNNLSYVASNADAGRIADSYALIYLCNIGPGFLVSLTAPYWFHAVSYRVRMMTAFMCLCVGAALIRATSSTELVRLVGVMLCATQVAIGEPTCLALSQLYSNPKRCIVMWSSGTGLAGVGGYGLVIGLTALKNRMSQIVIVEVLAVAYIATFMVLLTHPTSTEQTTEKLVIRERRDTDLTAVATRSDLDKSSATYTTVDPVESATPSGSVKPPPTLSTSASTANTLGAINSLSGGLSFTRFEMKLGMNISELSGIEERELVPFLLNHGITGDEILEISDLITDFKANAKLIHQTGQTAKQNLKSDEAKYVSGELQRSLPSPPKEGNLKLNSDSGEHDVPSENFLKMKTDDRVFKDVVKTLTFRERAMLVGSLWIYWMPLFIVYIAEYLIQGGAWTCFSFDRDTLSDKDSRDKAYKYLNLAYQVGVFISRSSGMYFHPTRWVLWIMPFMQLGMCILFTLDSGLGFWNGYSLLVPAVFTGLLGGAVYVNAFTMIDREVKEEYREFSLSASTVAINLGILLAAIGGLYMQWCLFEWNGLPPTADGGTCPF